MSFCKSYHCGMRMKIITIIINNIRHVIRIKLVFNYLLLTENVVFYILK